MRNIKWSFVTGVYSGSRVQLMTVGCEREMWETRPEKSELLPSY